MGVILIYFWWGFVRKWIGKIPLFLRYLIFDENIFPDILIRIKSTYSALEGENKYNNSYFLCLLCDLCGSV